MQHIHRYRCPSLKDQRIHRIPGYWSKCARKGCFTSQKQKQSERNVPVSGWQLASLLSFSITAPQSRDCSSHRSMVHSSSGGDEIFLWCPNHSELCACSPNTNYFMPCILIFRATSCLNIPAAIASTCSITSITAATFQHLVLDRVSLTCWHMKKGMWPMLCRKCILPYAAMLCREVEMSGVDETEGRSSRGPQGLKGSLGAREWQSRISKGHPWESAETRVCEGIEGRVSWAEVLSKERLNCPADSIFV